MAIVKLMSFLGNISNEANAFHRLVEIKSQIKHITDHCCEMTESNTKII